MERVEYPALPVLVPRPTRGPTSIGSTESVTGRVQVVREPRGLWEWRFDLAPFRGRLVAEFEGFLADMEDGANWTAVSGFYPGSPSFAEIGATPVIGWAEGGWAEGGNWGPSLPDAQVAVAAAAGDREVVIDVSGWNGHVWRGFDIGFYPYAPGLYRVQRVLPQVGNLATCRVWPALERPLTTDHMVTLHPTMFMALVPGAANEGTRGPDNILRDASFVARQVLYADVAGTD